MPSISTIDSIHIKAAPDTVFTVISDYDNAHQWLGNYRCKVKGGGPVTEGSLVSHQVGRAVKFTRRIDKIIANERLEESYIEGDLKGTGVWTFEAKDGGTLAAFDCRVSAQSWLPRIGFILAGAKGHKDAYKTFLRKLKTHCEGLEA